VKSPASPALQGLTGDVTVVADAPAATVWVNAGDAEPLKLASPPYTAVMLCVPAAAVRDGARGGSGDERLRGAPADGRTAVLERHRSVGVPLAGTTADTVTV